MSRRLLTIFGATGNQGGNVIESALGRSELKDKYSLRGITRDPSSGKSKGLSDRGVEMVKGNLDDVESLKAAVKGSYGVFGMTDFWAVMDKGIEIQQGKNLFEACKAEGVKHYIFSALPYATKLTKGALKNVDHFDSKAEVAEFCEANKGDMKVSYFMPAMFVSAATGVRVVDGQPTLAFPFPSGDIAWPLFDPKRDSGKYVMGIFEGEKSANGVFVHAVTCWTTPNDVVKAFSKESGQDVVFKAISADQYSSGIVQARGEVVAKELTETMQLIGNYNYYGKGEEKNQKKHDEWLLPGSDRISFAEWAKDNGPWKFQ